MKKTTRVLPASVVAIAIGCRSTLLLQPDTDPSFARDLDTVIARAMDTHIAPGLAVAVIHGADVVYTKGFGFADRERGLRVTPDTQFYIGSTTKSFTALTGAVLASRGEMDLDMPLSHALPQARYHPDVSADQITLRDLLKHTHGMTPGGPVDIRTAFTGEFTDQQLLELLRFHPPASTGRAFAYSNLGYNVFSLALDQRVEGGWKKLIQREVLDPLDMRSTTAWMSAADPTRLAQPYELRSSGLARVEYLKRDENMHAAGGHVSTANDLARYIIVHINNGHIDRQQVLPKGAVAATHHQEVEQNRDYGSFHRIGWGLGWDIARYRNETVLQRFGAFQGFFSHVSFMPDRKIGVVVLVNGGAASGLLADFVATYAYDRALGMPNLTDRTDRRVQALVRDISRRQESIVQDTAARQARAQTTALPLHAYAGTYHSEVLGSMVWQLEEGQLHVRMGVAHGIAEIYNGAEHQFRVAITGSGSIVTFHVAPEGSEPIELQFMNRPFIRKSDR